MKKLILILCILSLGSSLSYAAANQASFTPTGYQYPIMKISIMKADSTDEQSLYQCTGTTSAECLIDVTDPTALAAITTAATGVAIRIGTYTQIRLSNCPAGGGMTVIQVKGSATIAETVHSTSSTAASGMVVAAASAAEFTTIPWACGGAIVNLLNPLTVTEGGANSLSLVIDLTHSFWTTTSVSGMGGCKAQTDVSTQGVCGVMPAIVPYFGAGSPTFERYLVSHLSGSGAPALADANAAVNIAINATGNAFWVGVQPYYSETSPTVGVDATTGGPDYNAGTRTLSTNDDGTIIAFQTGGSAVDNRVGFTAFQRVTTHTGTTKNESTAAPTWNYQAYLQP